MHTKTCFVYVYTNTFYEPIANSFLFYCIQNVIYAKSLTNHLIPLNMKCLYIMCYFLNL